MKKAIFTVVLLALTAQAMLSAQQVIDVDLYTLLSEWEDNSLKVKQQYGNKTIRTTGEVYSISSNGSVLLQVNALEYYFMSMMMMGITDTTLWVYFNKAEMTKLANLRQEQTITVRGVYDGDQNAIRNAVIETEPPQQAQQQPQAQPQQQQQQAQQQPAPTPQPAPAPQPTATPAASTNATYKIGDRGPAGGLVFYDKGNNSGGWCYLEAAPVDLGEAEWGLYKVNVPGIGTEVGAGKRNTELIIAALNGSGERGRAAQLCRAYSLNGYNDWFLPSKDELDIMYRNLKQRSLGGFGNGCYWSSSQDITGAANLGGVDAALGQFFGSGAQTIGGSRGFLGAVRAVRAF